MKKIPIISKLLYNWHIKLISLFIAFLLWIYVSGLQEQERFLMVKLEIRNLPEKYIISNNIPDMVNVVLKGKEEKFTILDTKKLVAYVDFEKKVVENTSLPVQIDRKLLPRGLKIKEIQPRTVNIHLEKVVRKSVKVVPIIVDNPPFGYAFVDVSVIPDKVDIEGPTSVIEKIESIDTEDIFAGNIRESMIVETGLKLTDKRVKIINNRKVLVKISVKEEFTVKKYVAEISEIRNLKEGLTGRIENAEVEVILKQPKRYVKKNLMEMINLFIDMGEIGSPGEYSILVDYEPLDNRVDVININPEKVRVIVKKI